MRTFAGLFVGGIAAVVVLKLLAGLLLPLLGLFFGLAAMAIKLVVFALIAWFVYRMFKGKRREREA